MPIAECEISPFHCVPVEMTEKELVLSCQNISCQKISGQVAMASWQ